MKKRIPHQKFVSHTQKRNKRQYGAAKDWEYHYRPTLTQRSPLQKSSICLAIPKTSGLNTLGNLREETEEVQGDDDGTAFGPWAISCDATPEYLHKIWCGKQSRKEKVEEDSI